MTRSKCFDDAPALSPVLLGFTGAKRCPVLLPEGDVKIAQCFSFGFVGRTCSSSEGTADRRHPLLSSTPPIVRTAVIASLWLFFNSAATAATPSTSAPNPDQRGTEVVVVYNSHLPESKALAEYYAQKRGVPPNQVLGFGLRPVE